MNCVNWAKLTLLYPHRLARGGHIARAVDPDPHSFCLLDPDPGWKNEKCSNKDRKNARKLVKSASLYNF